MANNTKPEGHDELSNHSWLKIKMVRQLVKEGSYDGMELPDEALGKLLHDISMP